MPLNNDILGIYKAVYIYTSGVALSYIVDSVTRSVSMEASPKVMMTGSPKTRIMDLGGVTETISIQAPILIGGGASAESPLTLNAASYTVTVGGGGTGIIIIKFPSYVC